MKTTDQPVVIGRATFVYPSGSIALQPWSKPTIGATLALSSAAFYGIAFVLTKGSLDQIPPTLLITLQSAASVLFLSLWIGLDGRRFPNRGSLLKLGSIGILEPGLSYIITTKGLLLTSVSSATMIGALEPIVTICLACAFLRERLNLGKIVIAGISILGVCLISTSTMISQAALLGDALVLTGVLFAALYAIATQQSLRLSRDIDPLMVAWSQQSIALLFFLGLTIGSIILGIEPFRLELLTPSALVMAMVTGLIGHSLAFLLYLKALRYLSASDSSLYLSMIPVFGTTGAVFLLGEHLSWSQALGGLIVVGAIVVLARSYDH